MANDFHDYYSFQILLTYFLTSPLLFSICMLTTLNKDRSHIFIHEIQVNRFNLVFIRCYFNFFFSLHKKNDRLIEFWSQVVLVVYMTLLFILSLTLLNGRYHWAYSELLTFTYWFKLKGFFKWMHPLFSDNILIFEGFVVDKVVEGFVVDLKVL